MRGKGSIYINGVFNLSWDLKRSKDPERAVTRSVVVGLWTMLVSFKNKPSRSQIDGAYAAQTPWRRFRADRNGSAAVEFSLIALISILLLTEALQAGLYFYTSAALERAVSKASRQIMTGNAQGLTATQFRTSYVCPVLATTNLSCTNVVTNIQTLSAAVSPGGFYPFVNAAQTALIKPVMDNTKTSFCVGSANSYVYVQAFYAMPVFSLIWRAVATTFNGASSFLIQSTAVFRNEPFQATATSSC
jgi:Flp pilus assembly protein TadG